MNFGAPVSPISSRKLPGGAAPELLAEMLLRFRGFFRDRGYTEHRSVPICSGIDSSVRFIGSHISVLKPFLIGTPVPKGGLFVHQDCIRTRNLNQLFDENFPIAWGSFFTSMGVLSPADQLDRLFDETLEFLLTDLGVSLDSVLLRVSRSDNDLVNCCTRWPGISVEADTRALAYYRHKFGLDGVSGRNLNLAFRSAPDRPFNDIGNIIVIEREGSCIGIEAALGTTTIIKEMLGLDHVLDCYESAPKWGATIPLRKLQDALVTSLVLLRERLRPWGTTRGRILRSYLKAISYYRHKTDLTFAALAEWGDRLERNQYDCKGDSAVSTMIDYLVQYERQIQRGEGIGKEDEAVAEAMREIYVWRNSGSLPRDPLL